MFKSKKILPVVIAIITSMGMSTTVLAEEIEAEENVSGIVSIQENKDSNYEVADSVDFTEIVSDCSNLQINDEIKVDTDSNIDSVEKPAFSANGNNGTVDANTGSSYDIWKINDSVFVGDGNLTKDNNIYLVTTTSTTTAFLKLASSKTNLAAVLCIVNSDGSLSTTNLQVTANASENYGVLPAGNYAIVVTATDGTTRGAYNLMWNCANPSGANYIINKTSDLARVVLFYSNNEIRSNGENILSDLKWEEKETWYTSLGYSGRSVSISGVTSKGTYLGSFSSSAPSSTNNALFVEVSRCSYGYMNSYYRNDEGLVTHIMDYTDPSGLKTPRTLGDAATDFDWGNSYVVIDLNTFKVIEFLSPFNYYYTKSGGRTFSKSFLIELG